MFKNKEMRHGRKTGPLDNGDLHRYIGAPRVSKHFGLSALIAAACRIIAQRFSYIGEWLLQGWRCSAATLAPKPKRNNSE
jgi:hypothetical protein